MHRDIMTIQSQLNLPDSLLLKEEGAVLYVGINREPKRNAIDDDTIKALGNLFDNMPENIRCAILYGVGKHFCAGLDLSALVERDIVQGIQHSRMWHKSVEKIQFGRVPVISVLHGAVLGGGLEIAAGTHIRVSESTSFYGLPEGQRGIFVGGGGSVRLPKLIGEARMQDMMLTGRVYQAEEGHQVGFAQYLVAEGEGLEKARTLAENICSNAYMTNFAVQHVLPRIGEAGSEQGLLMESLISSISQSAPEAKERLRLFLAGKAKKVSKDD